MNLTIRRATVWLAVLAMAVSVMVLTAPSTAQAATAHVTTNADAGAGSFRQAVEDANNDLAIRTIRFTPGLDVALESTVTYTGSQNLTIDGRNSTVNGSDYSDPIELEGWDEALFRSRSDANITLRRVSFVDSFGSGVAMFIPENAGGTVRVTLDRVTIDSATFHGLFIDGQAYDGYNTDDIPHPECDDPWFFDSQSSIRLTITSSSVTNNGQLPPGYDLSTTTGCPADYDGIRVDQGGDGSIRAVVSNTKVDDNLADGLEYDETGDGHVISTVRGSSFNDNGATGTDDLDDGFDIDEVGGGDVIVTVISTDVKGNEDEGLDIDEAGDGKVVLNLTTSDVSRNFDENVKVDEEDGGNLASRVIRSQINSSKDSDGARFTEAGDGDFTVTVTKSVVTANDGQGIRFEQETPGGGSLRIVNSDLSGNDGSLDDRGGVTVTKVNVIE